MKYKSSVIICTRERHSKLRVTLARLNKLLPKGIPVFLVDQSSAPFIIDDFSKLDIRYFHTPHQKGLGRARNMGLSKGIADVMCWIDDDCIVSREFIAAFQKTAKLAHVARQKRIAGVFGQTRAYFKTRPDSSYQSSCLFTKKNVKPVTKVGVHWKDVGYGNNMILFGYIFDVMGPFKNWLGPGSISKNGDDGEFILRCLINKYSFLYDPNLLMYHNMWMTPPQFKKQYRDYYCGGLVIYGFYAFQNVPICQKEFQLEVRNSIYKMTESLRSLKKMPETFFTQLTELWWEFSTLIRGVLLAFWFAKVVPIPLKERINVSREGLEPATRKV
ncbi:hypothetical protein BH10PAT2_BH10PAT2_1660 [soil metagenome]